jgi:hypothetical protein
VLLKALESISLGNCQNLLRLVETKSRTEAFPRDLIQLEHVIPYIKDTCSPPATQHVDFGYRSITTIERPLPLTTG